ncbi:RNA-binding S4 domain-containing protein [Shinella sp. H4-D48]|jgi:ribosome-associated heat shock protein Hsp15|uniref:RNA-binding S4 domain-containing protein n=2 Tax=Shinella TaxID=323620 RepID=A0ABT0CM80_9HYPH|nr:MULTISPECIES: RNA-binding S4 domain-containing protein [Shinella]MCJ8149722.1 RNA-binding S4 domain-containing protein [Shinella sedimenti]UNK38345.1 RNA-binding S4 domain-containing protein [Shinella sp. H4-D48]
MARDEEQPAGQARQRIDKWLFFARLRKSRSLAAKSVESGDVRVNDLAIRQPSYAVRPGDVIVLSLERHDMVVKVLQTGERRGPYEEARLLYSDMTPPPPPREERNLFAQATRERGAGRPTKRERREIDRLHDYPGEGDD